LVYAAGQCRNLGDVHEVVNTQDTGLHRVAVRMLAFLIDLRYGTKKAVQCQYMTKLIRSDRVAGRSYRENADCVDPSLLPGHHLDFKSQESRLWRLGVTHIMR